MSVVAGVNTNIGWFNQVTSSVTSAFDRTGRNIVSLTKDLADTKTLIAHLKSFDIIVSIGATFYGRAATSVEESIRGSLKGWNAIGTMSEDIQKLSENVTACLKETTFRAIAECASLTSGVINKTYDIVSFLENQITVPVLKGMSDRYKDVHMQALGVGSAVRAFFAGEKVVAYLQGKGDWKDGWKSICDLTGTIGSFALSVASLGGFGSRCILASSALSTLSQSVKYGI
jgi:hypothetical protein